LLGVTACPTTMVYATRRFEFSASHRYWRDDWSAEHNEQVFGKCISPYGHGHNYTLDVTVKGTPDATTGMFINLTELKAIVGKVLDEFDHKHLNEDTPYFKDLIPTTENIVRVLWRLIAPELPPNATLARLRLYELNDLWAEYDGADEATFARSYVFSAAHRLHAPALSNDENQAIYGKCNNPNGHGHNYTVEVAVGGPVDPTTGMVIDMVAMDATVRGVLDTLEHRHLDKEVAAFADMPSTGENIAVYLWRELAPRFEGHPVHIKLWETNKNIFEFGG
jgi:6-pyruvoyltetrahydropterin/6-carboxytetrahydropterin synthase